MRDSTSDSGDLTVPDAVDYTGDNIAAVIGFFDYLRSRPFTGRLEKVLGAWLRRGAPALFRHTFEELAGTYAIIEVQPHVPERPKRPPFDPDLFEDELDLFEDELEELEARDSRLQDECDARRRRGEPELTPEEDEARFLEGLPEHIREDRAYSRRVKYINTAWEAIWRRMLDRIGPLHVMCEYDESRAPQEFRGVIRFPAAAGPLESESTFKLFLDGEMIGTIRAITAGAYNLARCTYRRIGDRAERYVSSDSADGAANRRPEGGVTLHELIAGAVAPFDGADLRYTVTTAAARSPDRVFDPFESLSPRGDFPVDALPAALRRFVADRAATMGTDPAALAWAALSACSAAIHGGTRLRMKQHDSWTTPASLWVALIGPPSAGKTPALEAALAPLEALQRDDMRVYQAALRTWKALPAEDRKHLHEPKIARRLLVKDATIEALQVILGEQDRGVAVVRDELAGWLGSFDRYGKTDGAGRAFYLEAYNGGPFVCDRIARGTTFIDTLLVTMLGGIQPDRLRQFKDLTDDGLLQRFLPIIVAPARPSTDAPRDNAAVGNYTALIKRLVDQPPAQVRLSQPARQVRERLEQEAYALVTEAPFGSRFATFCGKLVGTWGRLCLTLHCIEPQFGTPDEVLEGSVGLATAEAAERLLWASVYPHALAVFRMINSGGDGGGDRLTEVAGYILAKGKTRLLASQLARDLWSCRGLPLRDIQDLVSPLLAGGWLGLAAGEFAGNAKVWTVNPIVHVQFAAKARAERERRAAIALRLRTQADG